MLGESGKKKEKKRAKVTLPLRQPDGVGRLLFPPQKAGVGVLSGWDLVLNLSFATFCDFEQVFDFLSFSCFSTKLWEDLK